MELTCFIISIATITFVIILGPNSIVIYIRNIKNKLINKLLFFDKPVLE